MKVSASVISEASSVSPAHVAPTSDRLVSHEPSLPVGNRRPVWSRKLTVMAGAPVNPPAVEPSIATVSVMTGSAEESEISPGTANAMSSAPAVA